MGTAVGPWVHFGDVEAPSVQILDEHTVTALIPSTVRGAVRLKVTNPDRRIVEVDATM
jgi:hypothetical protein